MNIPEFESHYREQVRDILSRLQAVMLMSSQMEATVAEIGETLQSLSQEVETFLNAQKSQDESS